MAVPWPSVSVFRPRRLTASDVELLVALAGRVPVDAYVTVPAPGLAAALAPRLGRRGSETLALLEGAAVGSREVVASASAPLVEVHASHGPDRQAEVLREVLVGLFADDPTLEPRHVAVVCPDVAALAPHLRAVFAPPEQPVGWQHPGRELRVQVADAAGANRLYALLRQLAHLGRSRATASDLLGIAAHPFVARRFRLGADDLDRLTELVGRASVRWGLNPAHRARFGLDRVRQGTWQVGVQRLLLGEALSDDTLPSAGVVATVDDVESSDAELLGAVSELVTRVSRLAAECLEPATAAGWVRRFRAMVDQVADVPFEESWQLAQVWSVLAQVERRAGASGASLGLSDALAVLDAGFATRGVRPAYGNGSLVVGSLEALAAVPHRVVCLVGLDERTFPRRGIADGDDLLPREPHPGDPDPGADDRQHLLDALVAASERLVVVYQGHSTLTHEPHHPPSGLVDLIEAPGTAMIHEPLQPFAPASFEGRPRSFDRTALAAARALTGPRLAPTDPFAVGHLPLSEPVTTLELDALRQFLAHPARYFLKQRASLTLGEDDPVADDLPLELDGLGRWKIGNRVLASLMAGHPAERVLAQEWLRGELPPGGLGRHVLESVAATAAKVMDARAPFAAVPAEFHALDLDVGGLRVTGRAATRGDVTLVAEFGNVSARYLATAWLDALALTVALERRIDAVVVGGKRTHRLVAPPPDVARGLLATAADLAVEGLQRVLPIPPRVGQQWARARALRQEPQADKGLRTTWSYDSDDTWARFFPQGRLPWQERIDGEPWAQPGEPTVLGSLAALLWAPIVRADT